jgi:tRNA U34 2-thiouridine synthase MnmA/TrmU
MKILHPRHGYGQNLNPCLDCKIFMVGKTLELGLIDDLDFDFVLTGEVVGQRPKSQRRETMPIIAKESGANDRLLRPLCALNLPPTLPEREGWVNRDQLFGFHGRSRKPQMELAEKFGFSDYAQPAGGCCFLTDETYSNKLRDLWEARDSRDYQLDDIMLLKIGRHIRPRPHFKLIIGREEGENRFLAGYRNQFTHLAVTDYPGPLALLDGNPTTTDIELAARILARYSQGRAADKLLVTVASVTGLTRDIEVTPMAPNELEPGWHVGS